MRNNHFVSRSFYLPRTFYIRFRRGVLSSDGKPESTHAQIFMHEYTHLIQDQSSIYGAVRFMNEFDRLQDLRRLFIDSGGNVSPPLNKSQGAIGSWSLFLDEVEPLYYGSQVWSPKHIWAYESHTIETRRIVFKGKGRDYPIPVVKFVDNVDGTVCKRTVGLRELLEGYAVAVETIHSGGQILQISAEQFEYYAIERILAKFGEVRPEQIVILVHWALQNLFPAAHFFHLIDRLENEVSAQLPNPQNLYDILRTWALEDGLEKRIEQVERSLTTIVDHHLAAGSTDPLYRTFQWYREVVMANLERLLDHQQRFPLDTFLCYQHCQWDEDAVQRRERFVSQHPLPQAENHENQIFNFGAPEMAVDGVFLLRSLSDLYARMWFDRKRSSACPHYEMCDPEQTPQKGENCLTRPWELSKIAPYCYYGAAAKYADADRITVTT